MTGEGGFFEVRRELDELPPKERADQTARRIRDDGVRALLRDPDVAQDMGIWREIKPVMREAAAQGASATELYVLGMQQVLGRMGKERWAQKATSYIFLADDILGEVLNVVMVTPEGAVYCAPDNSPAPCQQQATVTVRQVLPTYVPVPATDRWALILLALGLFGAGLFAARRRLAA